MRLRWGMRLGGGGRFRIIKNLSTNFMNKMITYDIMFVLNVDLVQNENGIWVYGDVDHSKTPVLAKWRSLASEEVLKLGITNKLVVLAQSDNVESIKDVLPMSVVNDARTEYLASGTGTANNHSAISSYLQEIDANAKICIMTNFYHIPRASLLSSTNRKIESIAAECFFVDKMDLQIIQDYGCAESPFAKRLLGELRGMRDFILGNYSNPE